MTSRARQREQAAVLVARQGRIVAEFFEMGESRMLPWMRRLQAASLVAALADPDRGWDAIVIGDYERAFYGSQYASMAPLFEHYGIHLSAPGDRLARARIEEALRRSDPRPDIMLATLTAPAGVRTLASLRTAAHPHR